MANLGNTNVPRLDPDSEDGIMAGHGFKAVGLLEEPIAVNALKLNHHVTVLQNYKMGSNVDATWYLDPQSQEKYMVAMMRLPTGNKFYQLTSFDLFDRTHPFEREMSANVVKSLAMKPVVEPMFRTLPTGDIVARRKHYNGPT